MEEKKHDDLSRRFRRMTPEERVAFVTEAPEKHGDAAEEILASALQDRDRAVRYASAETIGSYGIPLAAELETALAGDPDFLVRVACAESLGMLRQERSEKALTQALADRHYLVRGWAADSLSGYRKPEVRAILHSYLDRERFRFGQVNALAALIRQGEAALLPRLMTYLTDSNYRTRSAAVHLLRELIAPGTAADITAALGKRLEREKTIAVKSAIATALASEAASPQFQRDRSPTF